jgi:hypothetical protein
VVLPQEIMKEKRIERTTDLQKVSVDFVVVLSFFRERFNLKSFFRILVGFEYSGACIFVVVA